MREAPTLACAAPPEPLQPMSWALRGVRAVAKPMTAKGVGLAKPLRGAALTLRGERKRRSNCSSVMLLLVNLVAANRDDQPLTLSTRDRSTWWQVGKEKKHSHLTKIAHIVRRGDLADAAVLHILAVHRSLQRAGDGNDYCGGMVCSLSSRTTQLRSAAEEKVQSKPGEDGEATGTNIILTRASTRLLEEPRRYLL